METGRINDKERMVEKFEISFGTIANKGKKS